MVAQSSERQREKRKNLAEVEKTGRKSLDDRGWGQNGEAQRLETKWRSCWRSESQFTSGDTAIRGAHVCLCLRLVRKVNEFNSDVPLRPHSVILAQVLSVKSHSSEANIPALQFVHTADNFTTSLLQTAIPLKLTNYNHMIRHRRCVFINYNWINQLSNTTIWWLDMCCLLHRYQLHVSALMAIFRLID